MDQGVSRGVGRLIRKIEAMSGVQRCSRAKLTSLSETESAYGESSRTQGKETSGARQRGSALLSRRRMTFVHS